MQTHLLSLGKRYIQSCCGLKKACWRGIIFSLIESTLMGMFYFLSLYFVDVLHFSVPLAGMIISFYGLGAMVGGYASGKLSDKINPAIIASVSLFTQAIIYLSLIHLTQPSILMAVVFILGMAGYGFITSSHLWVLSQCTDDQSQKVKALNLLSIASNLGISIAAILMGIFSYYGFNYIFTFSGTILLLMGCYIFIQEKGNGHQLKSNPLQKTSSDLPIFNQRLLMLVLIAVFFIGFIVVQRSSTYSLYIRQLFPQLGIQAVSILLIINSLIVVLLSTPIGDFISTYNKTTMTGIGGFLIGFGMFMLIFSHSFIMVALACVVYTFGEIIFFCMAQLICYDCGGQNKSGHSLGLFRLTYASSRVLAPAMGTYICASYGYDTVWYISFFIGLTCLFLFYYSRKLFNLNTDTPSHERCIA